MMTVRRAKFALLAAAAAVPLALAGPVQAQYRVDTSHANDANPRVGSGGYNGGGRTYNPGQYGNDIVYGNVSGGKQFRGAISSFNPYNFQATTSGLATDRFIRESSGTTTGGNTSYNAEITRPYYSPSQTAVPPQGYARQPYAGGYVPQRGAAPVASDLRIDAGTNFQIDQAQAPAGTYNLPGPANPDGADSTIDPNATAPGFRPGETAAGGRIDLRDRTAADILSPYTTLYRQDPALGADDLRPGNLPLNQGPLDRGQRVPGQDVPRDGSQNDPNNPNGQGDPNDRGNSGQSADAPSDLRLGQSIVKGAALDPLRTGTDLNVRNTPRTERASLGAGSSQYAAMQERLNRFRAGGQQGPDDGTIRPGTTVRRFGGDQVPDRAANGITDGTPARPGMTDPTARPTRGGTIRPENPADAGLPGGQPDQPDLSAPPAVMRPQASNPAQPVKVSSLGMGVDSKALKGQLDKAEKQMQAGKFTSAVDTYDAAEQVSPNNPLVLLGRANAELGSGYYRRAEQHLRDAYAQDQALLMGQYDLKSMIGTDRLNLLVKELRDQVKSDPDQAGPVFLLAYIDYNTGNERRAGAYLDLAQKRSPKDLFYAAVKKYWSLPDDKSAGDEANK